MERKLSTEEEMKVDKKEFLGIIRAKGLWTSAGITWSLIIPDRPKIRTEVKSPFYSTFYFTIPESQEIKKVTVRQSHTL